LLGEAELRRLGDRARDKGSVNHTDSRKPTATRQMFKRSAFGVESEGRHIINEG
jgi:hypothetical protein